MTPPKGRRFEKGQSGNPRGRPASATGIAKLRADIAEHLPNIIKKLVELAEAGDAQAARLLLERVLPPVKAAEQPTPIPIPDAALADQGRAVVAAAANGLLAPSQASQLLAGLGSLAKLIETDELAERIAALEKRDVNKQP